MVLTGAKWDRHGATIVVSKASGLFSRLIGACRKVRVPLDQIEERLSRVENRRSFSAAEFLEWQRGLTGASPAFQRRWTDPQQLCRFLSREQILR